jgi:hypothetical protein
VATLIALLALFVTIGGTASAASGLLNRPSRTAPSPEAQEPHRLEEEAREAGQKALKRRGGSARRRDRAAGPKGEQGQGETGPVN